MRIAIDLTVLADNFSGIERYASGMARALLEVGPDDEFVLFFKDDVHESLAEAARSGNAEVRVIPSRGLGKLAFSQAVLPCALAGSRADVTLFLAFPAPLLYGGASVSTVHDLSCLDCPQTMTGKSKLLWRKLDAKAVASPHGVITISEFSKSRIVGHYEADPGLVTVAYCGVDDRLFNPAQAGRTSKRELAAKYGLPKRYILSLSTIEPRKNLPLLVGAWAHLCEEEGFECGLVLAGRRGWKVEGLLDGIAPRLRDRVVFTGFVEDCDLPALYANADACVFPSVYEGFGLPPVEAVRSGARVLCSDIPCFREVCGDAAEYFGIDRPEGLEAALRAPTDRSQARALPRDYSWHAEARKVLGAVKGRR